MFLASSDSWDEGWGMGDRGWGMGDGRWGTEGEIRERNG